MGLFGRFLGHLKDRIAAAPGEMGQKVGELNNLATHEIGNLLFGDTKFYGQSPGTAAPKPEKQGDSPETPDAGKPEQAEPQQSEPQKQGAEKPENGKQQDNGKQAFGRWRAKHDSRAFGEDGPKIDAPKQQTAKAQQQTQKRSGQSL